MLTVEGEEPGYRLRIGDDDIGKIDRSWSEMHVRLEGTDVFVRIRLDDSFWRHRVLRGREITRWMVWRGLDRWKKGRPHKMALTRVGEARFEISLPEPAGRDMRQFLG